MFGVKLRKYVNPIGFRCNFIAEPTKDTGKEYLVA